MKKLLHLVMNRIFLTGIIVAIQLAFILLVLFRWGNHYVVISAILRILSIVVILHLIWKPTNSTIKLAWIVPILIFPLFGGIFYLAFGHVAIPRRLRKKIATTESLMSEHMPKNEDLLARLEKENPAVAGQSRYLLECADSPLWDHTDATYFDAGLPWWRKLLEDLETAEHFIFLEFFILAEGTMWFDILSVLEKKAAQGIDVRLIYDDVGSVFLLPKHYDQMMEQKGIKCMAFNRLIPFMTIILNNRDHRKIVSIDGRIGYTGGINLSDEYVNITTKHGYWKDAGIRLEGEAVWNLTVMFLQMWNSNRFMDDDYTKFRYDFNGKVIGSGFVQPYGSSPFDKMTVGKDVYMNMIGAANRYFYAFTPYLVVDDDFLAELKLAARRGVDVRIVTPGIPDKRSIYLLTQSNYLNLIEAGVKIYKFTPGFIHSKCMLCDDVVATVGTINFDNRSFYHHFECGVLLYQADAIADIKKDMEETFAVSEEVTAAWCKRKFWGLNLVGSVLKLFSPLL